MAQTTGTLESVLGRSWIKTHVIERARTNLDQPSGVGEMLPAMVKACRETSQVMVFRELVAYLAGKTQAILDDSDQALVEFCELRVPIELNWKYGDPAAVATFIEGLVSAYDRDPRECVDSIETMWRNVVAKSARDFKND